MKIRRGALFLMLSVLVPASLLLLLTRMPAQSRGPVPLTAQLATTYYRYPRNEFVKIEQSTTAVRSDGSTAESRMFTFGGAEAEQRTVRDLTLRRTVYIDGPTQSVTTYSITPTEILEENRRRSRSCPGDPNSQSETLLGYRVVRSTFQGEARVVSWQAPDLNCLVLRKEVYGPSADSPSTIAEVRSLAIGEPDSRFFSIPQGYVERSPSQVEAELEGRFPGIAPESPDNLRESDSRYYDPNNKKP